MSEFLNGFSKLKSTILLLFLSRIWLFFSICCLSSALGFLNIRLVLAFKTSGTYTKTFSFMRFAALVAEGFLSSLYWYTSVPKNAVFSALACWDDRVG